MERVYYADIPFPLGRIWAAATDQGLFQLDVNKSREFFLDSVKRRIIAGFEYRHSEFDALKNMLERYFEARPVEFDLPMDLRGTEFQKAVWRAISRIPYGKLSSYSRLAAEVGRPRAVRAAGNAVGDNPLSIVIPCHRVIRSDGGLGGYGGELDVKRYLLRLEGVYLKVEDPRNSTLEREYPRTRDELLRYFFE